MGIGAWVAVIVAKRRSRLPDSLARAFAPPRPGGESSDIQAADAPNLGAGITMPAMPEPSPKRILVVDVGGARVKLLVTGQTLKRTMDWGPQLPPQAMVAGV